MRSMVEGASQQARRMGLAPSTAFCGPPPPTGEENKEHSGEWTP